MQMHNKRSSPQKGKNSPLLMLAVTVREAAGPGKDQRACVLERGAQLSARRIALRRRRRLKRYVGFLRDNPYKLVEEDTAAERRARLDLFLVDRADVARKLVCVDFWFSGVARELEGVAEPAVLVGSVGRFFPAGGYKVLRASLRGAHEARQVALSQSG